jgi:two-component system cell cycle sensor histidine kinase PleC
MLNGSSGWGKSRSNSLLGEYSALVGDAVLRERARVAERQAKSESELAARVKSDFISSMSHELRTPLNTVLGFSKILSEHGKRNIPDAEIIQYAELIHASASRLLTVINDILDMSKIRAGQYAFDAYEVDVFGVLRDCVGDCQQAAEDAGVHLRTRVASSLPMVRGDDLKLTQVFSNLLSNAIKFTPKDGEVVLEALGQGDGGVLVSVRDTGVGMSAEEIRVALEPFGQIDGGRDRWRDGTGLGLPIAKALVEMHGGKLVVTSVKGSGTDVTVLLPPAQEESLRDDGAEHAAHAPGAIG